MPRGNVHDSSVGIASSKGENVQIQRKVLKKNCRKGKQGLNLPEGGGLSPDDMLYRRQRERVGKRRGIEKNRLWEMLLIRKKLASCLFL